MSKPVFLNESGPLDEMRRRLAALERSMTRTLGQSSELGSVYAFAGKVVPSNTGTGGLEEWKFCDGSSLDTTEYATLFALIGYTFGGAGSSFNLPDARSAHILVLAGGFSLGDTGGNLNHTHTVNNHVHGFAGGHSHGGDTHQHPSAGTHSHSEASHTHGSAGSSHSHTQPDTDENPTFHTHTFMSLNDSHTHAIGSSSSSARQYTYVSGVETFLSLTTHTHSSTGTVENPHGHTYIGITESARHTHPNPTTSSDGTAHTHDERTHNHPAGGAHQHPTAGHAHEAVDDHQHSSDGAGTTGAANMPYQRLNFVMRVK